MNKYLKKSLPCTDKYLKQIHLSACFILKSGIIIRPTFVCFWHHVFLLWENAAKLSERKWGAVRAEYCTHAQKHQMCFWFQKLFLFGTGPFLWKNINCKCITSQVFFYKGIKKPKQCVQILLHTSTTSTLTPSEVGAKWDIENIPKMFPSAPLSC